MEEHNLNMNDIKEQSIAQYGYNSYYDHRSLLKPDIYHSIFARPYDDILKNEEFQKLQYNKNQFYSQTQLSLAQQQHGSHVSHVTHSHSIPHAAQVSHNFGSHNAGGIPHMPLVTNPSHSIQSPLGHFHHLTPSTQALHNLHPVSLPHDQNSTQFNIPQICLQRSGLPSQPFIQQGSEQQINQCHASSSTTKSSFNFEWSAEKVASDERLQTQSEEDSNCDIQVHVVEKEGDQTVGTEDSKVFNCKHCNYKSPYKHTVKRHAEIVHMKIKNFLCDSCEFKAGSKSKLKVHVDRVHLKIKPYHCSQCGFKSVEKCTLKLHVDAVHLKRKPFQCERCTFKSVKKSDLRIHIDAVHHKLKLFKCTEYGCEYSTTTRRNLKIHVDGVHKKRKPFECNICSFKSATNVKLKIHIDGVHLKAKPHSCVQCEFKSAKKDDLKRHVDAVHFKVRPFACSECSHKTTTRNNLKTHYDAVHLKLKPFHCTQEDCDYRTDTLLKLKVHCDGVHLNIKPFSCTETDCKFKTTTKRNLKMHVDVVHLKIRPHHCKDCSFKSATKMKLSNHIDRVHLKLKPFKCSEKDCDYEATTKKSVKLHVDRIHLQIRSFCCKECDFQAVTRAELNLHNDGHFIINLFKRERPKVEDTMPCKRYCADRKDPCRQVEASLNNGKSLENVDCATVVQEISACELNDKSLNLTDSFRDKGCETSSSTSTLTTSDVNIKEHGLVEFEHFKVKNEELGL